MKKISIKLKITLWYTLVMMIVAGAVLAILTSASQEMIERDIAERITKSVMTFSRILDKPNGMDIPVPKFGFYEQGVHMVVCDDNNNVIAGNIPFELETVPELIDNEMYAIRSAVKTNLIFTIILIIIAVAGGYFIIGRALSPVTKIRNTAEKISKSSDLSQRIHIGGGKDEIHSLANTFDNMLDKIEQAMEREKQFTSDASHELRTPVAVILSECEYMTDCAKTYDDVKESAYSVKYQAEKMSKLISELLTISRMDRNTMKTEFEETDISELLNFVCDEQEEIHSENITMHRDIEEGIVSNADRFLLARLFINLISNAYSYGKDCGTVTVSLYQDKDNITVCISDDGIGISENDLPKIWERFYQADSSRTANENGSMGLGLSMVKWIAECHGGDVSVQSKSGEGSRFTFIMTKRSSVSVDTV